MTVVTTETWLFEEGEHGSSDQTIIMPEAPKLELAAGEEAGHISFATEISVDGAEAEVRQSLTQTEGDPNDD